MDGYHPDRSWVYDRLYVQRGGLKPAFAKRVEEFITKAISQNQFVKDGGIRCPCHNCMCSDILSASEVKLHLYRFGFQPNYWYWTEHGEEAPHIDPENIPSSSGNIDNDDPFTLMQHMVDDAFSPTYDFQNMGDEGNEEENNEEPPNDDAQEFYELQMQMQLATLAKSVASIQAESSHRRRHPDYDEDESNDDGGEE